jgi:adenylate cyclase
VTGGVVDITVIVASVVGTAMAATVCSEASRGALALVRRVSREQLRRERLGRYFSPEVAARVEDRLEGTGGESRDVTILFSDLRDFTALSEDLSGPQVVAILNAYHERMVETIFRHGGRSTSISGMGSWRTSAPRWTTRTTPSGPSAAPWRCRPLTALNEERDRHAEPPLRMGIGIHTGTVVVGTIGASRRREYTAIGDAVNVAARIEELTKMQGAPILVSEETRRRVGAGIRFSPATATAVRGRSKPVETYVAALEPA